MRALEYGERRCGKGEEGEELTRKARNICLEKDLLSVKAKENI